MDVTDASAASRYEIREDGALAGFAAYRLEGRTITFHHTEVGPEFGGRGLALDLVSYALADARERGLAVVPLCPYVRRVISRAPERYLDLVPAGERARLGLPEGEPTPSGDAASGAP